MFFLTAINLFSLEVTKTGTLNFGIIAEGRKKVPASRGAEIVIKGIPGKTVEVFSEDEMIFVSKGTKIKIEQITFERKEVTLDKKGKGTFRVGGIVSILEKRTPGNINKELWVSFRYKK